MREFVVTLRSGYRVTVRADRVITPDHQPDGYVRLVVDRHPAGGGSDAEVVALFEGRTVAAVVAREHLVSEVPPDPAAPSLVIDDGIPF